MSLLIESQPVYVAPEPTPRVGRSERTKADILDSAFHFLWSRPFRDMSVNNLMASTAHSRTVFYRYFEDVHELMGEMLGMVEAEIYAKMSRWLFDAGDPITLLYDSLAAEVRICHRCGPFLKAVNDATGTSALLETQWKSMLDGFDDAVCKRIAADQQLGLIKPFDPRPVATALNGLNTSMYITAFGKRPRSQPKPVLAAISRAWISTLYGQSSANKQAPALNRASDPSSIV